MLNYFCLISVFIACIGLYGLAMAVTEQRTREIGIRRVLGASVSRMVTMISLEFLLLVLLANIIAWPAAYLLMKYWLSNYIYRIDQGPGFFLAAAALALFISFMTVCYRSVRAALKDPVKVLRYE
ncbi:MAG: FtsX-like permease family protein [candidate division Zixibacteria bacterium]|nr:FtsX-like permease family protein [candidate division Zixibacteria bacterium]MDD5425542.1 FtsX-like permease family protein [candidate division Zixibacteria bacterium]